VANHPEVAPVLTQLESDEQRLVVEKVLNLMVIQRCRSRFAAARRIFSFTSRRARTARDFAYFEDCASRFAGVIFAKLGGAAFTYGSLGLLFHREELGVDGLDSGVVAARPSRRVRPLLSSLSTNASRSNEPPGSCLLRRIRISTAVLEAFSFFAK